MSFNRKLWLYSCSRPPGFPGSQRVCVCWYAWGKSHFWLCEQNMHVLSIWCFCVCVFQHTFHDWNKSISRLRISALFLHFCFCKETNLAACMSLREIYIGKVRSNSSTSTSFPAQLAQICCITPKYDLVIDQLNINHIHSNWPKHIKFY